MPSVTVTTPVGVPAPGGVTVNVIGILCPTTDGSGASDVMATVGVAFVMVTAVVADAVLGTELVAVTMAV